MGNEMVDKATGEMIAPAGNAEMDHLPEAVLAHAKLAATALSGVIAQKKKPVMFNGEQYLEFEDWMLIGKFYGLTVKTREAEPVQIGDTAGAKARADVVDIKTGQVVGGAEAYCMRDEKNWEAKPWFQLASMAQTRAGSKSLRNILAWVVVLAGYRPTPAEEIQSVIDAKATIQQPKRVNAEREAVDPDAGDAQEYSGRIISEAQSKRFFAIWKNNGKTQDQANEYLAGLGIKRASEMAVEDYDAACEWAGSK